LLWDEKPRWLQRMLNKNIFVSHIFIEIHRLRLRITLSSWGFKSVWRTHRAGDDFNSFYSALRRVSLIAALCASSPYNTRIPAVRSLGTYLKFPSLPQQVKCFYKSCPWANRGGLPRSMNWNQLELPFLRSSGYYIA